MSSEKKEKLENLMSDAKELLTLFEDLKEKADINNKSLILKHIDRTSIAKNIIPYLDLKDIVNFRSTCKDINAAVSSTVALVSYYKAVNQRKSDSANQNIVLKNFKDVNEMDDIQMELESVKRIRDFLTQKLFQSESLIKLYKTDLDYLKNELKSQNEISDRLSEALSQTRDELEQAKRESIAFKNKYEESNKNTEENNLKNIKKTDDLMRTVEELKVEKNNLSSGVLKLKKFLEDLKKKNAEKSDALKSIRNFFLTSTLFKLKNVPDLDKQDGNSKGGD